MGASDPADDSPSDRTRPVPPDDGREHDDGEGGDGGDGDGEDRVDVVWFPDDDEYVVVAVGDGDRAVRFDRFGRYGVAAVGVGFAALGIFVLHGFVTANTGLSWPISGLGFAIAAIVVAAYAWWRYDPDRPPEVVARDVPVDTASEEYDFDR